jgi:hypothetical protein
MFSPDPANVQTDQAVNGSPLREDDDSDREDDEGDRENDALTA